MACSGMLPPPPSSKPALRAHSLTSWVLACHREPVISRRDRVSYVGSSEHKNFPSFAGQYNPRADASKCDPDLTDPAELTQWLRDAIRAGQVGELWEGDFPRYVWCRQGEVWYEGRLVNQELGQYKGYPLEAGEGPEGMA
jgi:hypothetical protein